MECCHSKVAPSPCLSCMQHRHSRRIDCIQSRLFHRSQAARATAETLQIDMRIVRGTRLAAARREVWSFGTLSRQCETANGALLPGNACIAPVIGSRAGITAKLFTSTLQDWDAETSVVARFSSPFLASTRMKCVCSQRPVAMTVRTEFEDKDTCDQVSRRMSHNSGVGSNCRPHHSDRTSSLHPSTITAECNNISRRLSSLYYTETPVGRQPTAV